jgi:hypothetical protein
MDDDRAFIGGLRLSSPGRARLDTIAPPRKRGGVSRTLSREKLERRLDDIIRRRGVEALNQMRDEARRIAPLIGRKEEFAAFDTLVGALLNLGRGRHQGGALRGGVRRSAEDHVGGLFRDHDGGGIGV